MIRRLDSKVWANRSQRTTGNVTVTIPDSHHRPSKPTTRSIPVLVQHVHVYPRASERYDEFIFADKEKEAATGRWVLNVIAAHEAYQKELKKKEKLKKLPVR